MGEESRGQDSGNRRDGEGRSPLLGRRRMFRSPKEALHPEAAPPPPKAPPSQRRPILSAASGVLSFILVAALVTAIGLSVAIGQLHAPGPLKIQKVVLIPPHTGVSDVITQLQQQGVIGDGLLFNVALVVEGQRAKIRAGEYLFPQQASLQQVIDTIVSGKQVLHSITLPEGLTSEQIVQRLNADASLTGTIVHIPAEGSLRPETYEFVRGTPRSKIIDMMKDAQQKILQQVWAHRAPNNPLKSPYELLTLASIVEKETGKADERPHVASVFLNRLKKGMRLQSDPTIVYGLVGGKGTLGAGITHAQMMQPTPYNTYVIKGLPPGPICNPSRASLEAVANPSQTKDLYFVADGTGGHVFAQTLAQHDKNVQRWREIEKMKAAAAPEIDRVPAQDVPLPNAPRPRNNKRSELAPGDMGPSQAGPARSIFGALPRSFAAARPTAAPSNAFARLGVDAAGLGIDSSRADSAKQSPATAQKPDAGGLLAFAGAQASPNFALQEPPPTGAALMDGPADDPALDGSGSNASASGAQPQPIPAAYTPPSPSNPRTVDASEGTPLDPLKEKGWDLNSPKRVPKSFE